MDKNIYLIGFMGSGKSYWSKVWAHEFQWTAFDLDEAIEDFFEKKIADIFLENGEDIFRQRESQFLQLTNIGSNHIIACGGGTPIFFDNMDWMLGNGIVIYLSAGPQLLASRLEPESHNRPLLKSYKGDELLNFIELKLKEREPYYHRAHHILDVAQLNKDSLSFILK